MTVNQQEAIKKKEKELERREMQVESNEAEVEMIILEAMESIRNEFDDRTTAMTKKEMELNKKLQEVDQMKADLKFKEIALRENVQVADEENPEIALAQIDPVVEHNFTTNDADVEMATPRALNQEDVLENLPILEIYFEAWDRLLKGKKEEIVRNVAHLLYTLSLGGLGYESCVILFLWDGWNSLFR